MNREFYVHGCSIRPDGSKDSFWGTRVESKESPLRGLSFTASGYGARIPTCHMVRFNGRWRRVYCRIYSNSGICYIGRFDDNLKIQEYGA